MVYGRTAKAYDRELKKVYRNTKREKGQVPRPEATWIRVQVPDLRIIDSALAEQVETLRHDRRTRYLAAVAKGGRVPERSHGKYLLSGGLLVCPTCGGHFEARMAPWKGIKGGVYICSTRRRKPGVCGNVLALPIAETDDTVLSMVEGEVLGTDPYANARTRRRLDRHDEHDGRDDKEDHMAPAGMMRPVSRSLDRDA